MSKIATLKFNNSTGRWEALFNNVKLCQSQDKYRVIKLIEENSCEKALAFGVTEISETPTFVMEPPIEVTEKHMKNPLHVGNKLTFPINQRFQFLAESTDMVIRGDIASLLVTGEGGLGKTHTVIQRFDAAGLQNSMSFLQDDVKDDVQGLGDYIVIKGFSTAKGLYRSLFKNRDKIIVFDDSDSVLEDKTAIMLLKGALDSHDKRVISWNAQLPKDSDVPQSFEFKGGVIFISNKTQNQIDQAIKSRCLRVDLSMTVHEKIERMEAILPNVLPDYDDGLKREALDFLRERADIATDLNIRTLLSICKIRKGNPTSWKSHAEYTIAA